MNATSDRDHARFLRRTCAVVAAGVLLAAGTAVLVDPYGLFGIVQKPGFNAVKPRPDRYQEEIKLTAARRLQPEVVIAGNSRAEIGFDPAHPVLTGKNAYNLAIPGTSIHATRRQLDYLHAEGQRPTKVILGVEFLDFLTDPNVRRRQVAAAGTQQKVDASGWKVDAVFSLSALADSLATLRLQRDPEGKTIAPNGFNPLLEYRRFAREGGYHALFRQRAEEYAKTFVHLPRTLPAPEAGGSPDLDALGQILRTLAPASEVHLVIYPYHAQILAMFEEAGLWDAFEQWKAVLAREVAAVRRAHRHARLTLWDFSGYSSYQCEPIPLNGDRKTETRWYWEAGHFKSALGGAMLSRMMGDGMDGFGHVLTVARLEENRQRIRQERASCAAAEPALFRDAAAMIQRAAH